MAKRTRVPSPPAPPRRPAGRPPRTGRGRPLAGLAIGAAGVLAAAGAWWFWPGESTLSVTRTPDQNVLIVTIDTLRADALGSYGGAAATPNLDRLAADGIRYDFAHAHSVITLPSHVSIFTGLYPFEHGVRENSGYRLAPSVTTLATRLTAAGYSTGAFIGAFPLDSQFGLDAGFGVYDDQLNEVRGPADFAFSERRADVVVAAALTWLKGQHGKWFAWVHVYDPHAPASPPEPYASRYATNPYAGEVAFTDSALGLLFDHVRAAGSRPTLVIVTGDHGEGLGNHGEATHGVFAYESTLRVPLIVAQYQAGRPTAGRPGRRLRVSSLPVHHVDIQPTVLDVLGQAVPPEPPGVSLFAIDRSTAASRASYFEALTPYLNRGWAPLRGVLVDRRKFIDLPLPELYDLQRDPAEARNLADTQAEARRVLEARLKAFGPTELGERRAEDAETTARLRSLGYTSGSAKPRKTFSEEDDPKRLIALDQAMHDGVELFQAGRLREAVDVYSGIVTKRPDMAIAYLHLAFLQYELGQAGMAIGTLRTGRKRAGASAEIDSRLGLYLSEAGAFDEALPLLESAVRQPDAGVDTFNALGVTYSRASRAGDAINAFQQALKIDPKNAMAWQNIGAMHLQAGNLPAARAAFGESLRIDPAWAASYTGLGVVEMKAGNRDAAFAAWSRAVELNPSDFDALYNLATELVTDGRFEAARPHLKRFVASAPPAAYGKDIERLRGMLQRLR